MKLHLHVKTVYFDAVKRGEKTHEYRLVNNYWNKILKDRTYEGIVYYNAYKPGAENRIEMPWKGCDVDVLQHPHFGPDPVMVWAIPMTVTVREADQIAAIDQSLSDLCTTAPAIGAKKL